MKPGRTLRSLTRICRRLRLPVPRHDHSLERGAWCEPTRPYDPYSGPLRPGWWVDADGTKWGPLRPETGATVRACVPKSCGGRR